ncbi:unnamed protein product [Danaus chrysippus]|uniref:(African queen) hypothetical protein n=1 Tax=Danaus chrysippus TaxID=151541 RepID=A0A8J2W7R3_9NEOP|nr:unnamed protein product [Danaus chrysippus]
MARWLLDALNPGPPGPPRPSQVPPVRSSSRRTVNDSPVLCTGVIRSVKVSTDKRDWRRRPLAAAEPAIWEGRKPQPPQRSASRLRTKISALARSEHVNATLKALALDSKPVTPPTRTRPHRYVFRTRFRSQPPRPYPTRSIARLQSCDSLFLVR